MPSWQEQGHPYFFNIARQAVISYPLLGKVIVPDGRFFSGSPLLWQSVYIRRRSCNNIEL